MKLLSHGPNSDLLTHLREVAQAAEADWELVALMCHDIGKATWSWQNFIRNRETERSPHPHAAAGGLLAAAIILEENAPGAVEHSLAALHAAAAHHSYISTVGSDLRSGLDLIAGDRQAKSFFLDRTDGIASELPNYSDDLLQRSWNRLVAFATPHQRRTLAELNEQWEQLPGSKRIEIYFSARRLLGKLGFEDNGSARRQSGKNDDVPLWSTVFADQSFMPRPPRHLNPTGHLSELRTHLRSEFLNILNPEKIFTFIDAPTGMGKTEAMLQGAEKIRAAAALHKIVFAVPTVSIADQIFEDYLSDAPSAQIWNYLRQEKTCSEESPAAAPGADAEALELEEHPFSQAYDVTTFNQVLLAMFHPRKQRCIKSLGLHDCVVIMDEFHKLPMHILPIFFRMARVYAEDNHVRFILGSATPFSLLPYWDLVDAVRLAPDITAPIYNDPAVNERRRYYQSGSLSPAELHTAIRQYTDEHPEQNLMAVVNLVRDGSWQLRREFDHPYQPWAELEALNSPGQSRVVIFLDGLVPPCLRKRIICDCKRIMRNGDKKITLVTTQMVEVGVDLDFDAAFVDWQGLAATIQRGGRVGREGRNAACPVFVFSLKLSDGCSVDRLLEVQKKALAPIFKTTLNDIFRRSELFASHEKSFFRNWTPEHPLSDIDLTQTLLDMQQKIFGTTRPGNWLERFFEISGCDYNPGAAFENAQYIAELSTTDTQDQALIFENSEECNRFGALLQNMLNEKSSSDERKSLFRMLTGHKISFSYGLADEMGLPPPVLFKVSGEVIPGYSLTPEIL